MTLLTSAKRAVSFQQLAPLVLKEYTILRQLSNTNYILHCVVIAWGEMGFGEYFADIEYGQGHAVLTY